MIATDCNTTTAIESLIPLEECEKYDIIIGDYWANPDRFERVEFTPSWLRTSLSTIKYIGSRSSTTSSAGAVSIDGDDEAAGTAGAATTGVEYSTMAETIRGNVRVCIRSNFRQHLIL